MARQCFVCSRLLQADDQAFQHHVNLCLDGGAPPSDSNNTDRAIAEELGAQERESRGRCPVCGVGFEPFTDRNAHVEECLGSDSIPAEFQDPEDFFFDASDQLASTHPSNQTQDAMLCGLIPRPSTSKAQPPSSSSDDEPPPFGQSPPDGLFTPSLLPVFSPLLQRASSSPHSPVQSVVLSSSHVVHCRAKSLWTTTGEGQLSGAGGGGVVLGSDVSWGCGYRNAQMVLSAVRHLPAYRSLLLSRSRPSTSNSPSTTSPSPSTSASASSNNTSPSTPIEVEAVAPLPTIREMQRIIERAWNGGWDPDGAAHFSSRLVGKRKWIGTTEVYVLMTVLGIRTRIIDFPEASGPNGTHTGLTKWVKSYFEVPSSADSTTNAHALLLSSAGSPIRQTSKPPLYLQHQGHSRTIVGFERRKGGEEWLIVLDPAKAVSGTMKKAAASVPSSSDRTSSSPETDDPSPSSDADASDSRPLKKLRLGFGTAKEKESASGGKKSLDVDLSQHSRLMEPYRVSLKSLSRKSEYQILCVEEHGPPLTLAEQLERKYVQSVVVK